MCSTVALLTHFHQFSAYKDVAVQCSFGFWSSTASDLLLSLVSLCLGLNSASCCHHLLNRQCHSSPSNCPCHCQWTLTLPNHQAKAHVLQSAIFLIGNFSLLTLANEPPV